MDRRAEITALFNQLTTNHNQADSVFSATVIEVDVKQLTCTIDYDGLELTNVRLLPTTTTAGEHLLIVPKKDTDVLVASAMGDLSNLWVIRVDTVEKIDLKCGDITLSVDSSGVVFNGGTLGGLVVLGELVSKLNAIEKDLNDLKTVFTSWTAVPNDGGGALKLAVTDWANSTLTVTQEADLENKKIQQ